MTDDLVKRIREVPEKQTPLNERLGHHYLDVLDEGSRARDTGAVSPYHGHSLEHCLHASGWVSRDLRLALDAANRAIEALTAELDRVRDKYEAKDGMDGAVVYAIRRLLNEANVPLAAFIDDHVLNAIIQRNVAEADNARLRKLLAELLQVQDGGPMMGAEATRRGEAARAALTGKENK